MHVAGFLILGVLVTRRKLSRRLTDKVEVHTEIEAHDRADFEAAETALTKVGQPHFLLCADACTFDLREL